MYNLYEFFGLLRFGDFSNDLYDNGVYTSTGLATIATLLFGFIVFYMLKSQKPLTFRLPAWFITVFILCIVCFAIAYAISDSTLYGVYAENNQESPYGFGSFAGFALINLFWSLVFSLVFSVVIQLLFIDKHGNVPFPFRKSHK